MIELLWLLVGIGIGAGGTIIFYRARTRNQQDIFKVQSHALENELNNLRQEVQDSQEKIIPLHSELSALQTENKHLQSRYEEQRQELEELQQKFTREFQLVASSIMEEKSKKFTDQNKANLSELLNPLKEKIVDFEKKIEQTHRESLEKNSALREQINGLRDLNKQMSRETENLTRALKGDSKARGNWGEFILESILEKSGLEKNREYFIQTSLVNEEGRRLQPDVLIKLPEEKTVIIDSKVSLVAYDRFYEAETDEDREKYAALHLDSIRRHIKDLGSKSYQQARDIQGLDFVLMFIPIEPAFSLAIQSDSNLFQDAYERNIVIVSPSTLIATLRTIANIWKNEYQNRNAQRIAEESGKLYDKFVNFTEDLIDLGKKLNASKDSYEQAMKKLSTGTGNLVKRTEDIKKLGAKGTKNIDSRLLEKSND